MILRGALAVALLMLPGHALAAPGDAEMDAWVGCILENAARYAASAEAADVAAAAALGACISEEDAVRSWARQLVDDDVYMLLEVMEDFRSSLRRQAMSAIIDARL